MSGVNTRTSKDRDLVAHAKASIRSMQIDLKAGSTAVVELGFGELGVFRHLAHFAGGDFTQSDDDFSILRIDQRLGALQ